LAAEAAEALTMAGHREPSARDARAIRGFHARPQGCSTRAPTQIA